MTPNSVHDIRNLCLLGHAGSGKTTLLEALLAEAGAISSRGSVERGDTVSDHDPQEKAMGHSLSATLTHLEWAGHWINLLDTPGLPDLAGRALATLPAVDAHPDDLLAHESLPPPTEALPPDALPTDVPPTDALPTDALPTGP